MADNVCANTHDCSCAYVSCANHGKCCDCIAQHKAGGSLPNCLREIAPKE